MFCKNCGTSIQGNPKFCTECGAPLSAAPSEISPPQEEEKKKKKGGGGFWTSGVAIALVVILGIGVIAGITIGVIFLIKGNSNNAVDAETVAVWDEYESILDEDSEEIAQINMDPNALITAQSDLEKSQKKVAELQKVLAQTGGTQNRRNTTRRQTVQAQNLRDRKANELAAALAAYEAYITKMDELYGALVTAISQNQLIIPEVVDNLNKILAELQDLGNDVKKLTAAFLKNNEQVIVKDFDPPILVFGKELASATEDSVVAAQQAEAARIAAEQAAAEQAAAAAAAEAERQRQAAQPSGHWERVAVVPYPCGNTDCNICYDDIWVED